MSEVWISTGKKYCDICKVYYGNNRASQDHHERGDRHKAMLQVRIREQMQKGKKQEQEDAKLNATLARMESAAASSMGRFGEGVMQGPSLPSTGLRMNIFDPKKHLDVRSMATEMETRRAGGLKRGSDIPSAGQMPSLKVTKDDVVSAYRDLTNPSAHGPALPESMAVSYMPENQVKCDQVVWVRVRSAEGTHYENIFDKSIRKDQPLHFYTEEQYEIKCREFESQREKNYYGVNDVQSVRQGKIDLESYIKSVVEKSGMRQQVDINRKELHITDKPEKKGKAEKRRRWQEKQQRTANEEDNVEPPNFNDVPLPADIFIPPPPPPEFPHQTLEISKITKSPESTTLTMGPPFGAWIKITKEESKSKETFLSPLTARYREEEEKEKEDNEKREKAEPKFSFEEKTAVTMTKKVKGPIEFKKRSTLKNVRKRAE